jgi:hypothetical protein
MKKQADLIVLEVSTSSLAIGQELEFAIANKKKVVALHLPGKEPHLLDGGDETFYLVEYKADELPSLLEDYIEIARDQMDVRFNFFVSPKIVNYLDWISQKRRMPRAVYLRKLIENKIKQDELYQKSVE